MYKATRELIKARQQYTNYVVEQVYVKNVDGGIENDCFNNATQDSLLEAGNKVVSGWLVGAYDKESNSTEIIQHWWNIDANGNYFDITPNVSSEYEYVIDCEISGYGQEHYDELDNLVACSLLLKHNQFFSVNRLNGKLATNSLSSLETSNLFKFN